MQVLFGPSALEGGPGALLILRGWSHALQLALSPRWRGLLVGSFYALSLFRLTEMVGDTSVTKVN